ncbi:MAG: hypothetical protein ACXVEF_37765 [Polyangiales bacterium]
MKSSIRYAALLACSVLVACSGDDAGTAPEEDTGIGEETSSDTGTVSEETSTDTGSDDSTVTDSGGTDGGADTTAADTATSDSTASDSTASDSAADSGGDSGADTAIDAPADGATDGAEAGKPCSFSGGGCSATEYCDTPTCDMGTCKPRPATPAKEFAPACGCDGVTYWNQSVAAVTGHSSNPGKCALDGSGFGTKFCGIKGCDPSEVCIADLTDHGMCGLGGFGKTCWRLVAGGTCPATAKDLPKMRECSGGTSGGCTGFCKAVLAEDAGGITGFLEDTTCP